MSVQDILDLSIASHFDSREQPNSKTWRASAVGFCARGMYLNRLGVAKTRVVPAKEKRTLEWGNMIHDYCKDRYRDAGVLIEPKAPMALCPACEPDGSSAKEWHIEDAELAASCHLDALLSESVAFVEDGDPRLAQLRYELLKAELELAPRVVEIKGQKSSAMKGAVYKHKPQDHQMMQLGTQALLVSRNPDQLPVVPLYYDLLLIGKDAHGYLQFPLHESWIHRAEDWLGKLNDAWAAGSPPACQCTDWRRGFCAYPSPDKKSCCSEDLAA